MSPSELMADGPRRRRDSAHPIEDVDVLNEEEVHGPLHGGYRPSSLRLIDEAVAAAQLIEPSLFADEELAALGIKRASAAEVAAAGGAAVSTKPGPPTPPPAAASGPGFPMPPAEAERAAAIARMKGDLADLDVATPSEPPTNGANGRPSTPRAKTVPPPVPVRAKDLEEAPLLDSDLLSSGEFKIPSDEELRADDTSGEIKLAAKIEPAKTPSVTQGWDAVSDPTEAKAEPAKTPSVTQGWDAVPDPTEAKAAAPKSVTQGWDAVDEPPATTPGAKSALAAFDEEEPTRAPSEDSGVPTAIEADAESDRQIEPDEGPTDPSRKRKPLPRPDDSQAIRMIGSAGRDRAEASGELRPPSLKADAPTTQRELVTIMPRRKTGEVAQIRPEDVSTLDAKGQQRAKAIVEAVEAKAEAKPEAKPELKPEAKPEPKVETVAKPAVETPRRVSVEGGVSVPERGPGRSAVILITLVSIAAGALVFAKCRKTKTTPVVATQQDATMIAVVEPDAPDLNTFAIDAGVVVDAGRTSRRDAAVRPDATDVAVAPDAMVPVVRADAAVVVVATGDGGTAAPTGSAAGLATKGRAALAEGEAQNALDLFDQSLKLKKDKKVFLDRARALANLGRVDDAVASIDEAIKMADNYAPAYEQKGLLLWSAQRYGEARPALEMYLSLQPDGPKAETIKKMLDEPR